MSSSFHQKPDNSKLRHFTVDAPEDLFNQGPRELAPEERAELNRLRQENNSPRITDHAKQRIEILTGIGRLTKDVEAQGVIFSIRTLKAKETREATMPMFQCANDIDAGFEIRRQTLARSVYAIDGQDIDLIVGGKDIERKLNLIDELEEATVSTLYNAQMQLKSDALNNFAPKTAQEAEGVREDLKK